MNLFHHLDREWDTLSRSRTARERLADWTRTTPGFSGLTDLAMLIDWAHDRSDRARSDLLLAGLAERSATSELAARTLLQALLPALRHTARCYQRTAEAFGDDAASVVVMFAWERIRTYPYDRRPKRIAANVVLDTRQHVQRHFDRPRPMLVSLNDLHHELAADTRAPDGADRLLEQAVARGVISASDAELIAVTRLDDIPLAQVAAQLDGIPQSLRRRRRRAETRLAAFV